MIKKLSFILITACALVACGKNSPQYQGEGSLKPWLTQKAQESGYKIRWNMNLNYDIAELHKTELKNIPIGYTIGLLSKKMSLDNIQNQLAWISTHPGQQYPYPILIAYALCDKDTIVLTEVQDLNSFYSNLMNGKHEGCVPLDPNLGAPPPPVGTIPVIQNTPPVASTPMNVPKPDGKNIISLQADTPLPVIGDPDREVDPDKPPQ